MRATMMAFPMTIQMIMRHGARNHGDSEVVTFNGADFQAARYRDIAERAARLAAGLRAHGITANDRVGTFCWNHQQHLEAYLGVPALGAVLHTLNIRLFPDQVAYIADHAEDRALIIDSILLPQISEILPRLTQVRLLIIVGENPPALPGFTGLTIGYEALLAAHPPLQDWPDLDEQSAAVVCYTSGTTGAPKGVVYSHKTIFVHSLASMAADSFAISCRDRILLLPAMFHSNAWGLPFSGWFAGSRFIMPAQHLKPAHIRRMVEAERPTFTAAVPTILNDLLLAHETSPIDMSSFRVIVSGGSAVSPALIEKVRQSWGVPILQGWGMTETSPLCVLSHPPAGIPAEQETYWRSKSGRPVAGVEVRIVDDQERPLPHDGKTLGQLQLRGPWIAGGYHNQEGADVLSPAGWLRTGDIGTIDERNYVQVTDRSKDVIKSGGEWISSVEIENHLARHPSIHEAAVIAIPDPRWEERPLALVVPRPAATLSFTALRSHLAQEVAKFWVPEYWATVESLPRTSVGKIDKLALRKAVGEGKISYHRHDGAN
jgi:fatty-acyl-CoA synthase